MTNTEYYYKAETNNYGVHSSTPVGFDQSLKKEGKLQGREDLLKYSWPKAKKGPLILG